LLVIDHADANRPRVVGTYRLLRQDVAMANGGFYSAGEFDLSALIDQSGPGRQLLELGRSCVAPEWRTSATMRRANWVWVTRANLDSSSKRQNACCCVGAFARHRRQWNNDTDGSRRHQQWHADTDGPRIRLGRRH
jgi:hypothetical protein